MTEPIPWGLKYFIPGDIRKHLSPKNWLAGGAIVRWQEGAKSNNGDWDFFTEDPLQLLRDFHTDGWFIDRESGWAWTLKNDLNPEVVQVIRLPFTYPTEVIDRFDFTVRQWITDGTTLYYGKSTKQDLEDRVIRFNNPRFSDSLTSLVGMMKYANRGYTLDYGEARQFLARWHDNPVPTSNEGTY